MPEERPEVRSWLADALSRRTRHPALEDTLFNRLQELERGPLEQLGALVHLVIDELRVAQQRLTEQAGDLRALQRTVAALSTRLDGLDAAPAAEPPPPAAHVLLLSDADGYRLLERAGPPPEPGERIELEERAYRVLNRRLLALPD